MQAVVDLATAVQSIPAPSFSEEARARFVSDYLNKHGVQTRVQDHDYKGRRIANAYARIPGTNPDLPALVVSAHTDTVFPRETDLTSRKDGGRLYGPGIGDNSLAVAALVSLAVEGGQFPCDLYFVANACEEGLGDLAGARTAVDYLNQTHQAGIGAAVVLEGMLLGGIYHAGIGVRRYRIAVEGPGGHSWGDYGRSSAIHELTHAIERGLDVPVPAAPRSTINVGTIEGGTSINTIAATATAQLDVRSITQEGVDAFADAVIAAIAGPVRTDESDVSISCELIGSRPAGSIPDDHPLVQAAIQSLDTVQVDAKVRAGSTDANAFLAAGIPAVCVGITTGRGAHTMGEYIDTEPVATGMEQVRALIPRAAEVAAGTHRGQGAGT